MIDITNREDRCFALMMKQCTILIRTECTNCKFYKPRDCEDWIRLDLRDRIVLVEPEEYEKLKGVRHE